MSSKKLRKYLAYYRKTLSDDPDNIEARLRLAALFREMGRPGHAIDEYGTAAKLLASEGLPLESIAACKAILELDPSHKETQFFLARLYAQVPEATGDSVRVARPVTPIKPRSAEGSRPTARPTRNDGEGSSPRIEQLPDSGQFNEPAITLDKPKGKPSPIRLEQKKGENKKIEVSASEDATETRSRAVTRREQPGLIKTKESGRERTQMKTPMEQTALRTRSRTEEEDRQSFEFGVFDINSLGLDEASKGQWENLDFLDELDEPDTVELELDEENHHAGGGAASNMTQREFRVSALPAIPLFSQLPRKVFVEILDAMELEKLPAATEILRPDDPASCIYVVVSGQVRVEKDLLDGRTVELATMGEGQVFGEFRLLTGKGGRARVVAETDVELLTVQDEVMYRVGREYSELWAVLWSFYYDRMLNHAMAASELFGSLSMEERELVVRHFKRRNVPADEILFKRGESVDTISLIVSGSVDVAVPDAEGARVVETLAEGSFVGVSPCSREAPATATVRTRSEVVLFEMKGSIFRELLYGLPEVAEAVRKLVQVRRDRIGNRVGESSAVDWI